MNIYNQIPSDAVIKSAVAKLEKHNIEVWVVNSGQEAVVKFLEILPRGAEVMDMSSTTLEVLGLDKIINESGDYNSTHSRLKKMDRATESGEMQKLGAAPEWVVGSVHAITEDGKIMIASQSGSQIPAYVYGSEHVLWVAGAHKIVKDLNSAWQRVHDYVLPLESERAKKAYGVKASAINKLLIINKEPKPNRITLILVKEVLGF